MSLYVFLRLVTITRLPCNRFVIHYKADILLQAYVFVSSHDIRLSGSECGDGGEGGDVESVGVKCQGTQPPLSGASQQSKDCGRSTRRGCPSGQASCLMTPLGSRPGWSSNAQTTARWQETSIRLSEAAGRCHPITMIDCDQELAP
jgi:hypothetical protein